MNSHLDFLSKAAAAEHRVILGLMSGTSLDGLDMALCQINNYGAQTQVHLIAFDSHPYEEKFKEDLRSVFAKDTVDMRLLCGLHQMVARVHANMVNEFLLANNIDKAAITCIASHGQTVMHVPAHSHILPWDIDATLQIGDGDHLAALTGLITISDFRQKHIALGGQGAPLAVYGDFCLFSDDLKSRVLVNLGGIANFTFLPNGGSFERVFVTDTGPANTLIDAWVREKFGQPYDPDGSIAAQGKVNEWLLQKLQDHPFFKVPFPKTTGPEAFHMDFVYDILDHHSPISDVDVLTTLTYFTAWSLSEAILQQDIAHGYDLYVSGGGCRNATLMSFILGLLNKDSWIDTSELGIPADIKEAVLFAILANETIGGNRKTFYGNAYIPNVCMGKISFPV
ncbi:MAG: anhydro-N-acetylmuramic acid kinase [Lewinellaceae bacterium]|nr:anhydro-N-acetylmuramic acid kinase [Lewinellaceae bacterium]